MKTAHAWRYLMSDSHRIFGAAGSLPCPRSVSPIRGCSRRNTWNAITHRKPSAPVTTKAARQPHRTVTNATMYGAITEPRLEPLLQTPIASVRAFFGTHVAVALANAGHPPPSP